VFRDSLADGTNRINLSERFMWYNDRCEKKLSFEWEYLLNDWYGEVEMVISC